MKSPDGHTLADTLDRLENLLANAHLNGNHTARVRRVLHDLVELLPLADLLREHARVVHNDGTPAQVGIGAEEAARWAERIRPSARSAGEEADASSRQT